MIGVADRDFVQVCPYADIGIGRVVKNICPTFQIVLPVRIQSAQILLAYFRISSLVMLEQGILANVNFKPSLPYFQGEITIGTIESITDIIDPAHLLDCFAKKQAVIDHHLATERETDAILSLLRP